MPVQFLYETIEKLCAPNKGILAADESLKTIEKRFQSINIANTEENRREYRNILFSTPHLNDYISGIILFEETLYQSHKPDITIAELLTQQNIVIGIKVDEGLVSLPNFPNEKITRGLDTLPERISQYKSRGARFAKWRCVFTISSNTPSETAIRSNAETLGRYAALCQEYEIVPIVEPEVLMDGNHSIQRCAEVTENVLKTVFKTLQDHQVRLECILLKPNMVLPGKSCEDQSSAEAVAEATLEVLKRSVPKTVPSINFLSGGQSSEEATLNLNAINILEHRPWVLSFSFGRALQDHCLKSWAGNPNNISKAQQALHFRAKLNCLAMQGKYSPDLEPEK